MIKKIRTLFSSIIIAALCIPLCSTAGVYAAESGVGDNMEIIIDGNDVLRAADNVNGLTYKGFGVLSANSTSNLLLDYKYESPEAYNKMLRVLFGGEHPLMNHVKVEMGNDGNNSTGADSCTMRYEDEEADASRSPGFVLAADAKKVNKNVKVSILRWEMPAWVQTYWDQDKTGKGYEAVYKWYSETIFDAYEKYGYILDYVNPDKNETGTPDGDFIKWFKNRLVNEEDFPSYMDDKAIEAYHNIKIIASDEYISLNIVPAMRRDGELYDAVDAIGFHYTTGTKGSTDDYVNMADIDDKEVWYSEGCGSFSYTEYQENKNVAYGAGTIGGYQSPLAMCDCMIKSAVYSRKTHYIFQPAIGSFYEGSEFDHKELLSAREPWSGHIHFDEAIYLLEHFSKFAKTGWENSTNTAGIWRYIAEASYNNSSGTEHLTNESGEPSYMTLASPDGKDFSTIIVNNSPKSLSYALSVKNMDIEDEAALERWESCTDSYMQYKGKVEKEGGYYYVDVEPYSIVTVTTLECNGKTEYTERLPEESYNPVLDTNAAGDAQDSSDNVLYADDFKYDSYDSKYLSERGNEPRYMVDYSGAFYVEDGRLVQGLTSEISQWRVNTPSTVVGDYRWMNYTASVDVTVPGSGYAGIVIREQTGMAYTGSGYNLQITNQGNWTLKKGYTQLANGSVGGNGEYRLALTGKGNKITAYVNDTAVYEYEDSNAELFGRVRLFSDWDEVYFDNLKVMKLESTEDDALLDVIPYGSAIIDNASDNVTYSGNWDIAANGSSNDWYRSTSKSSSPGAAFEFEMSGDGFSLIGKNDSASVIDVEVDGSVVEEGASVNTSNNHCSSYIISGLGNSSHKVKVTLKSGTFVLDAIMPIGNIPVTVTGLSFEKPEVTVEAGKTYTQTAKVLPDNADYKGVLYSSSDSAVAKVNETTGEVTAVSAGSAVMTAKAGDGSKKTASYIVNVPGTGTPPANTGGNGGTDIHNNGPGNDNKSDAVKELKAPKLKSCKRTGNKVKLKWSKVTGADGYIIKRSVKKKKGYKVIKKINKQKTVKYTDKKKLKKNKKYYYKVCAFKKQGGKTINSKYSNIKCAK